LLYNGGVGRISIRYSYIRVIIRSTRLDKSPGEENFQIKLVVKSHPYTLLGHTTRTSYIIIIIIIMCIRDDVSESFAGITSEQIERKFSYNPKVNNKTNMTTGSDFWFAYMRDECAPQERDGKKKYENQLRRRRRSITLSRATTAWPLPHYY